MRLGQEVAGKGIDVAPDASEVVVGGNGDAETERGVGGRGEKGGEEVVVGGGGEEEGEAERGDALDAVEGGDGGPAGDEERS